MKQYILLLKGITNTKKMIAFINLLENNDAPCWKKFHQEVQWYSGGTLGGPFSIVYVCKNFTGDHRKFPGPDTMHSLSVAPAHKTIFNST